MPESLQATTRKQVSAIVGESSCPDDNTNCVEDEIWGFRITGGFDFGIPITVFHVSLSTENVNLFIYERVRTVCDVCCLSNDMTLLYGLIYW